MGTLFGRQRAWLLIFLMPAVLYITMWRILPALYTVYLSFTSYNLAFDPGPMWVGLQNYARLMQDSKFLGSLAVTAQFSVPATAVELIAGLGMALLLDRALPLRNIVMGISLVPMVLAPVTVATMWYVLFHDFVGPIPNILHALHGPDVAWF